MAGFEVHEPLWTDNDKKQSWNKTSNGPRCKL